MPIVLLALTYLISSPLLAVANEGDAEAAKISPVSRVMPSEFLGVSFGSKFDIQECASFDFPQGVSSVYDLRSESNTFPCWLASSPESEYGRPEGDTFEVDIIVGNSPAGVGNIRLLVITGHIEGITYTTNGIESQDDILQALNEKLGPPTETGMLEKQNAMGAKFNGLSAAWTFTNGRANFVGIGSSYKRGFGDIYTSAGAAYVDAQRQPKGTF